MKRVLLSFTFPILITAFLCGPAELIASKKPESLNKIQNSRTGFTENKGQIIDQNNKHNPAVLYLLNMPGMNVQLRSSGWSYDVYQVESSDSLPFAFRHSPFASEKMSNNTNSKKRKANSYRFHRIDIDLLNANPYPEVETSAPSAEYLNYYTTGTPAEGITGVRSFTIVTYKNIYPGIDLQFISDDRLFEYNFILQPGADINSIKLKVYGPQKIKGYREGLRCETSLGDVDETIPVCYYTMNDIRVPVKGRFKKIAEHLYGFSVDKVIPSGAVLLIDPIPTRRWGTYYGGTLDEFGPGGLVVDPGGNVFMGATTNSTSNIATAGAFQVMFAGNLDAFLVKFNGSGQRIWGTYFGGENIDMTYTVSLDPGNNVFIAGFTTSSTGIASPGAFQTIIIGGMDSFVAKFDPSGIRLWSTYFGGNELGMAGPDMTLASATDSDGNIYCAGQTSAPDFPVTPGAHQTTISGPEDAFLIKFTGDGNRVWGTFYGGTSNEQDVRCCLSNNTFLYLSGSTGSPNNIATPGSFMPNLGTAPKGFLACFNKNGVRSWGTYFGGESTDKSTSCVADTGGSVYLYGTTNSSTNIATIGTYQTAKLGSDNAYLEKFNSSGNRLWGTYFGAGDGAFYEKGAVDDSGFVYLAGSAWAQDTLFFSPNAYQTVYRGSMRNAFLVKFSGNGQRIWSTYYSGMSSDWGICCATDLSDNIYLTGRSYSVNQSDDNGLCTRSSNRNFISTPGSHQRELSGPDDEFLVKFADCYSPDTASQIYGQLTLCQNSTGHVYSIDPLFAATGYHWCVTGDLTITSGQGTVSITVDVGSTLGWDTISVYGINSCDNGFPKVITRRVYPRPIPLIMGTDSTCTGVPELFTTSGEKINYQWSISAGGVIVSGGSTTDSACTVAWSNVGLQWISLAYTDTTGCAAIAPTQWPVVVSGDSIKVTITSSTNNICAGTPVTFTAIPTNPGATPTYQWKVNGANSGTNSTGFTYTPLNGDVVSCILTSSLTVCISNNPATSNSIVMIVNPNLPVSITISPDTDPVCAGSPVTFTAYPIHGGITPSYQWKLNGANAGTNNPVYSFVPNNGDLVSCVLTSSETCTSNNPASSIQHLISVSPLLPISITISPSANPFCTGSSVTFTATPTNGGTTPSYQWKVNGTNAGTNSPNFTYNPVNSDQVNCILTSSELCTSSNPASSISITMIQNNSLPAGVSISASSNPFCPGSSVNFTATPTNGGGAPIYHWKVNGINVGTNSTTYSYNPTDGDSVRCIMTSNLSCVTGNPASSAKIIMSGTLAPVVTFTSCFDTITTVNAKPIKLKGGIPLGGTYSGPGVNSITGVFNPTIAGTGTKTITYSYTNSILCSAFKSISILNLPSSIFNCGNTITDVRDNKVYQTIQIGTQCWMSSNLNFGTTIASSQDQRDNCIAEKYCYNDNPINCTNQGGLYQWDELMLFDETPADQGFCPPGWHIPTENEWNILFASYINSGFAGSPLKYSGYSGFNAILSGARLINKGWDFQGFATFFWSSTTRSDSKAWVHGMNDNDPSVSSYPSSRVNAYSVRCLKD